MPKTLCRKLFAPFYSDHFGVSINISKGVKVFKHMPTTVPDYLIHDTNISGADQRTANECAGNKSASKRKRDRKTK